MRELDLEEINPGVREVVRRLREHGFDTCDSGDGLTNVNAGMGCTVNYPHVHMMVDDPGELTRTAEFLHALLERDFPHLFDTDPGPLAPDIQATYSPVDKSATISLLNVNDLALEGTAVAQQMLHGHDKKSGQLVATCDWETYGDMRKTDFTRFELCPRVTGCERCAPELANNKEK